MYGGRELRPTGQVSQIRLATQGLILQVQCYWNMGMPTIYILSVATSMLQSGTDRDSMACKTQSIYYLVLYRNLPAPALS